MNANGTNGTNGSGPAARYQSPVDCPGGKVAFIGLDRSRTHSKPADQADSRERAALMRAFTEANTALAQVQEALGAVGSRLFGTHQRALTAIDAAERLALGGMSREARDRVAAVRARHANDGPESLLRSPRLWRWLLWPVVVASVCFDTTFVGTILQQFFDATSNHPDYWFCYFPGMGLAVCQLAAGSVLGESVFRWRTRAGRTTERVRRGLPATVRGLWRPRAARTERRAVDDLPWPHLAGPAVFALVLFAVIAVWARLRAHYAVEQLHVHSLHSLQGAVPILTLVLSMAAVLVKALAHNPYADRAAEAAKSTKKADERLRTLVGQARGRLVGHTESWHRLRSAVEVAEATAHGTLEEACTRIVEERARSGTAGSFDLPLTGSGWPWPRPKQSATGGAAAPEAPNVPRLRLELLDHYRALLKRCAPGDLEDWLEEIAESLNRQFHIPEASPELPEAAPSAEPPARTASADHPDHPEPPEPPDPATVPAAPGPPPSPAAPTAPTAPTAPEAASPAA